jgi:hypothetical protein
MENKPQVMSSKEKQEAAFQKLLSPKDPAGNDLPFQSAEAETRYKSNLNRIKNAIQLKPTDRVPVTVFPNMFSFRYGGYTVEEVMYDYEKCVKAHRKFVLDFDLDMQFGAAGAGPGKFYEILDYKLYAWAGHGVGTDSCYQCLEKEYMKEEEYDLLISDPTFYFRNFYLPRVFGGLGGWSMLPPLTGILEMYGVAFNFIPFGLPPVQETYQKLFAAGAEALKWAMAMGGLDGELTTFGYPNLLGGFTKAPFDVIGDTLRGTEGVIKDIYRNPEKLLKAMEVLTPLMIGMGIGAFQQTGNPLIFIPLHKGADGFMSDDQFKIFYWPTLKQVILGLIEGGCVPFPCAEGSYNTRLKYLAELPAGQTLWMFDQTDLVKAKEIIGDKICMMGNLPASLLNVGSPQDVKDYCKKMIDSVGKNGGYIVGNGSFIDEANPENLKMMIDFTKEYGVY